MELCFLQLPTAWLTAHWYGRGCKKGPCYIQHCVLTVEGHKESLSTGKRIAVMLSQI
jgi:hypothetical protein